MREPGGHERGRAFFAPARASDLPSSLSPRSASDASGREEGHSFVDGSKKVFSLLRVPPKFYDRVSIMRSLSRASFTTFLFLVLLVCFSFAAAEEEEEEGSSSKKKDEMPDFDFNTMGQQPCPNFRCSSGMTPVPKSVKFTSTGCSSLGGSAMMMNMGQAASAANEPYATCCDQWHACYQVCGATKKTCDETFKSCSKEKCGADEECQKQANLAGLMIGFAGCQKFDQQQLTACECVAKDKASEKREAIIRRFYKKYAPDKVENAADLAAKADSAGKLAKLFRKLITKYPVAIELIEDPQQAVYRQMMEDAKKAEKERGSDTAEEDPVEEEEVQEL
jgi:hypothetical protein